MWCLVDANTACWNCFPIEILSHSSLYPHSLRFWGKSAYNTPRSFSPHHETFNIENTIKLNFPKLFPLAFLFHTASSKKQQQNHIKYVIIVENIISICILWQKIIFRRRGKTKFNGKTKAHLIIKLIMFLPFLLLHWGFVGVCKREELYEYASTFTRTQEPTKFIIKINFQISHGRFSYNETNVLLSANLIGLLNYWQSFLMLSKRQQKGNNS
jgi:hypothetical protein